MNDVLFYIPQFLFNEVRTALASPHAFVSLDNLHWLGEVEGLKEHVWLQYHIFHPANTARSTNPVYASPGRETGYVSTGKFIQYNLEQQGETEAKIAVGEMSDSERQQVWSDGVCRIVQLEAAEGRVLEVHLFVNQMERIVPR